MSKMLLHPLPMAGVDALASSCSFRGRREQITLFICVELELTIPYLEITMCQGGVHRYDEHVHNDE